MALFISLLLILASNARATDPNDGDGYYFHCRPEVIAAFDRLYSRSIELNEQTPGRGIELVLQIVPDGDGLGFHESDPPPPQEIATRRVTRIPGTIAIAHNHPPGGYYSRPSGVDCDTSFPNYVLTGSDIFATNAKPPDSPLYGNTGDPGHRGSYRMVYSGENWRERYKEPGWEEYCRQDTDRIFRLHRYAHGFPRCLRNSETEAAVQNSEE